MTYTKLINLKIHSFLYLSWLLNYNKEIINLDFEITVKPDPLYIITVALRESAADDENKNTDGINMRPRDF